MSFRLLILALAPFTAAIPATASAQGFSNSYQFLKAIRDSDGTKVTEMLNEPGQNYVNIKDRSSGEAALHIVARRGDATYLRFLLQKGANPNIQDARGNTAAMMAVEANFGGGIPILQTYKADFNIANSSGETPLIRAVQLRNITMVRALLEAGANPDKADVIAGLSARDYARRDTRSPAILKLIESTPTRAAAPVSGPVL